MLPRLYLAWVFTPLIKFLKWKESVTGCISWKDVHFPLSPMRRGTRSLFHNHKSKRQGSNTSRQPDAPLPKTKLLLTGVSQDTCGSSALFAVNFVILLQAFYFNIIRNKISYFAPSLPSENPCEGWGYKLKKQRSFRELAEVPWVTLQLVPRFLSRIKIGKWVN